MDKIPKLIKQARKLSGLTQQQLAQKISADKGYVSLIESGKKGVSINRLNEIMDVLGFDLEYVIKKYCD